MSESAPLGRAQLDALLAQMARVRTLVLGDVMLDTFIWGRADRVSPEAPVLVVRAERDSQMPGGAGNVVRCLRALGAQVGVAGVVGDDADGATLARLLAEDGADPLHLLPAADRPTTVKTRILAGGQQVVRVDRELAQPLPADLSAQLDALLRPALTGCQGLLLSDYDKGVLQPALIDRVLALAAELGVRVAVNAKPHLAGHYRRVDLLTVNRVEAEAILDRRLPTHDDVAAGARDLAARPEPRHTLITLGPEGAMLLAHDGEPQLVPALPVQVYDVAGAGDTTVAAAHLALCAGAEPRAAIEVAMRAAAVVVRKRSVATASPDEILALAEE
ncbi:MAG TPA: hypothetical protein DCZ72_07485 [Armatimonadetes bacterium]|nr:hypothetical protein [Armatimonadota bacterium]